MYTARHLSLVFVGVLSCSTSAYAAGGAYVVDDAAIGKLGDCQIESWISVSNEDHSIAVSQPACVVNLGVPVEITVLGAGTRSDGTWFGVAGLQGKLVVVPVGRNHLGVAVSLGTQYDLSDGQSILSYVNVPISIELNQGLRVLLNGGYTFDDVTADSEVSCGAGFEWDLTPQLTLISEVYGLSGGTADNDPRFQAGLRYSPRKDVDLDAIVGDNITGEHARWLTAGITVRY